MNSRAVQLAIIYQRVFGLTDAEFAALVGTSRQTWNRVKHTQDISRSLEKRILQFIEKWLET